METFDEVDVTICRALMKEGAMLKYTEDGSSEYRTEKGKRFIITIEEMTDEDE